MPIFQRQRLFLVVILILLFAFPVLSRTPNGLRWEKIPVYNALPSVVFAKLGLNHSTKNGYTRDGRQGVPDPGFPPGLTDVVPYDAEKILLVRGTAGGLSLFRARVESADVPTQPTHLRAELTPLGSSDTVLAAQEEEVADGVRKQISLGDGPAARVYQITERVNPDGTFWIACRVSLPLPDQSALTPTGPVFIPERIWTDPMSRKVRPGETVQFDDLASVRRAAARKLGAAGTDTEDDYTLRVTLTPPVTH